VIAVSIKTFQHLQVSVAAVLFVGLAGCGGGGGSASSPPPATSIAGTVVKGPVAGASVTAYAIDSGLMGRVIGSATTDGQGNFSISVGEFTGAAMLRATGGHFIDEASGIDMPMEAGDAMAAMIASLSPGAAAIQITPLTSIAQAMAQRMAGGMSGANIASANAAVGGYFMAGDILHVRPMNPLAPGSGSPATADGRNYGMALAGMSQLAAGLGMASTSAMVTAMSDDGSDGCFDGMTAGAPIMMQRGAMMGRGPMPSFAGTSGMANAMALFAASSLNRSGLTVQDMQALINRLMTSNCAIGP
jgi:hypothetical protein